MKVFDFKIIYGYLSRETIWVRVHKWHWGIALKKRPLSGWKLWIARPSQKLSGMAIKWGEQKVGEIFAAPGYTIVDGKMKIHEVSLVATHADPNVPPIRFSQFSSESAMLFPKREKLRDLFPEEGDKE